MMNSRRSGFDEAFVWIWLPDAVEPVVAGKVTEKGHALIFNYGRSHLARVNAISLHASWKAVFERICIRRFNGTCNEVDRPSKMGKDEDDQSMKARSFRSTVLTQILTL